MAKDEAGNVKDTAVGAGKEVAATAKEEAANVAGEAKQQAKSLVGAATSQLKDQAPPSRASWPTSLPGLHRPAAGPDPGQRRGADR